jgi:tRNA uridine 5-carboxymethylaminomethyl modification enzyme
MAGQINGTSGYEEAAAQGLWAGINAALQVQKRSPFLLDRSEAYIGVMIDDLVTRGTKEPYRIFTSRAEYRLLLREDNADLRLMEKGYELGLIDKDTFKNLRERRRQIAQELERIDRTKIKPSAQVNQFLAERKSAPLEAAVPLAQLLKRPELSYGDLKHLEDRASQLSEQVTRQVEIQCKYQGYLQRQEGEVKKFKNLEKIKIPPGFDYQDIPGLSNEIRQNLREIQPTSLGQASRISGMTPAALSILMVYLKRIKEAQVSSQAVLEKDN